MLAIAIFSSVSIGFLLLACASPITTKPEPGSRESRELDIGRLPSVGELGYFLDPCDPKSSRVWGITAADWIEVERCHRLGNIKTIDDKDQAEARQPTARPIAFTA